VDFPSLYTKGKDIPMSSFDVTVRRVIVEPHPNADRLELGQVDDYKVVIPKGEYKTGDLAVYIPEQAIVPEYLIQQMGLEGKLAGSEKNRVKAIRLRGELSQGLLYRPSWVESWEDTMQRYDPNGNSMDWAIDDDQVIHFLGSDAWVEGKNLADELGITKWEPPVPANMAGNVKPADGGFFRTFTDIENIKKHPRVIQEGEQVAITEKLHGTCFIAGIVNGKRVVSSKGIASRHLTLEENPDNLYWRAAYQADVFTKLENYLEGTNQSILVFGEVIGIQDLKYGLQPGQIDVYFFDVYTEEGWADADDFFDFCKSNNFRCVPILYVGDFDKEILKIVTTGNSLIANHVREGAVVRLMKEREDKSMGRVIVKSINPDYLTRKGEVTEWE
jgi:RNA ligase (TIGR02306 family)